LVVIRHVQSAKMSAMNFGSGRNTGGLWAITCYFNPIGYRRRLVNYRIFREHLDIPLVAVELAYGPGFELEEKDADILVQLRSEDILWQKERLLNVALQALPSTCRKVVWVDCDVVFESADWAERTSLLLDRFMLVQPFSQLHCMPSEWQPGHGRLLGSVVWLSVPFRIASGMTVAACLGNWAQRVGCTSGQVWAAARELVEKQRLYDAFIIGGGDGAILRAAYGCPEAMIRLNDMNKRQSDHYLAWAAAFHDAVQAGVGFVEGNLAHLWHGDVKHRRYHERWSEFRRFQFDPFEDIALHHNGAWRWNTDKREMHDYVRNYLASRREDG
jgi:hypothetical protein